MIQLYNYYRSSASFRVRIALSLKKIPYEDIPIHLVNQGGEHFHADYQHLNPQGLVPLLRDGEKTIPQSLAIIEYLDEMYPEPSLLHKDPYKKSQIRSFALMIAADIHPLNNLRVLKYLTNNLNVSEAQKQAWYQEWITKGFSALEKQLDQLNVSGDYCFGESPTLADIFLIPQMYNARRFSCDITPFPRLIQIDAFCQKNPAFREAFPENSPFNEDNKK